MCRVTLLALCACNQVFDLRSTKSVDATHEFYDAPIDAPYACPPVGETPQFAPLFHQAVFQNCKQYAPVQSRQLGLALCDDGSYINYLVSEGPLEGPLTEIPGFLDPSWTLQFMRASLDGDEILLTYYKGGTGYEVRVFRRTASGWERRPNFASGPSYFDVSNPSGGPERHAMRTTSTGNVDEYAEDAAGAWNLVATHPPAEVGSSFYSNLQLSADGLRLVFTGQRAQDSASHFMYTSRAALGAPFQPAGKLEGIPIAVFDATMNDDCSRVYFSGLESIFYVQRL